MTYMIQLPIPIFLKFLIEDLQDPTVNENHLYRNAGILSLLVICKVTFEIYGLKNGARAYVQSRLLSRILVIRNVMSLPPGADKHIGIGQISTMMDLDGYNFGSFIFLYGHFIVSNFKKMFLIKFRVFQSQ